MAVYIFLGASGSGKDTQAEKLSEFLQGVPVISTGQLIRDAKRHQSLLGGKAAEYESRGELVPDEIIFSLLEENLSSLDLSRGLIFTGFPRTLPQAENLDLYLSRLGIAVTKVFHLETSLVIAKERIQNRIREDRDRGQEPRKDDLGETIDSRLRSYQENITPILSFYRRQDKLVRINNEESIEAVFAEIVSFLEEK